MSIYFSFYLWDNLYIIYKLYKGLIFLMIKEKRKAKNYTQEQMASLLGISLRQYVRIDKEEDLPRRDVLQKLISELDLTDTEIGKYIRNITKSTVA